ncbi:rho GTPase-activating protein 10-like [Centroberyx affinis]
MGSNESVSSQSSTASASETPPKKTDHTPLCASLSSTSDSGAGTAAASWTNSGASGEIKNTATAVASDGDKPEESVTSRKAKAVYPCEAEHDSELSFQVGAIFNAVTSSREPGWLEGELEGKRGLIPENYVEML